MRSVIGVGRLVCQISMGALSLGLAMAACAATVQVVVQDGAGKPLPGAVAFLESPEARRLARPVAGAEIVQQRMRFNPDVLVVPVGTAVSFPNRDTVRHHVYSFSPAKKFELKLYAREQERSVHFDKPGVVPLGCNIHDQMSGFIVVADTPWAVRTDASGSAVVSGLPAGQVSLSVWHPYLRTPGNSMTKQVALGANGGSDGFTVALRPPPRTVGASGY